jgi:hypothetical protein
MLLTKVIAWSLLYPIALCGFAMSIVFTIVSFLFNSPVDIWIMISNTIDENEVSDTGQQ